MKKRTYAKPQLHRLGLLRERTSLSGAGGSGGGGGCTFWQWIFGKC